MESSSHIFTNHIFKQSARIIFATLFFGLAVALFQSPTAFASSQLPRQTIRVSHYSLGLLDFGGKVNKSKKVELYWDTAAENNIAGFYVWKRTGNGTMVKMNTKLVAARTPGMSTGNSYRILDKKVKLKNKYTYQLEVISLDGYSAWSEELSFKIK